jgi:hypothetical protein
MQYVHLSPEQPLCKSSVFTDCWGRAWPARRVGASWLKRSRGHAVARVQAALALPAAGHTARSGAGRRAAPAATGPRSGARPRGSRAHIPAGVRYPADTGSNTACAFPSPFCRSQAPHRSPCLDYGSRSFMAHRAAVGQEKTRLIFIALLGPHAPISW